MLLFEFALQQEHTHIKRHRIKAAGENDTRATCLSRRFMCINHQAHPCRLAAQVHIIHAGLGTCLNHLVAIELIRANCSEHKSRASHKLRKACGIGHIGHDQWRIFRRTNLVAHSRELVCTTPTHRPANTLSITCVGISRHHVFSYQAARKTCCAVNHHIKFFAHKTLLR